MIAIQLSNVGLILGGTPIFRALTWEIQHDQKIGLIGPNGAGKSSIFKLIMGECTLEPGGSITRARSVTVGYLPQEPEFDLQSSAFDLALGGNPRIAEIQTELSRVETSLSDPLVFNDSKKLGRTLERQQALLDEFSVIDGASYEQRVHATLMGLGLNLAEQEKPLSLLSGGQKKVAGLARLLMKRPSVLLLDEPDNHLDLDGKAYLERLISEYPGAVVIISHDRYLLDACVTHISELEDGRLQTFNGDYSSFIIGKEERMARHEELFRIQQREIGRLETSIKRYALWGKIYDNEKFAKRAKTMQARLDRMKKIDKPILERRRIGLQLDGWRGSNKVLELKKVEKSFGSRSLLSNTDQVIWHGERVGLIGPNGAGKSVLLRMILGLEHADQGQITLGPSVKLGYYAQEHETLDPQETLLEAIRNTAPLNEASATAFLVRYLFTYQQVTQKINILSGGERSRLQLALLVLSGANFLLLDEPTNNLDIASAEVLENALADFIGTVLVISHDRYFLDRTVQRLLAFENGTLINYPGGFSDYLVTFQ